MLRRMRPDLFGFRGWLKQRISRLTGRRTVRDFFREQLWLGSIQAAIVMSVEPGRVAAYSDMLDCMAILGYNPDFLREFALRKEAGSSA